MKKTLIALTGMLLIPGIVFAAEQSVQSFLRDTIVFVNSTVVPLLFALAFLFFIVNVARYFIIGGGSEDARKKAKTLALWGIIAFVIMVSLWGIVNLLVSSLGVGGADPICPDFLCPNGSSRTIPPPTGSIPTTSI